MKRAENVCSFRTTRWEEKTGQRKFDRQKAEGKKENNIIKYLKCL